MKEDVNKVVGQRIKQRRKELGLSQDELAKKIGYKTKGAISYFENGLRSPDFEVVQKIAEALNTDLKYFWVGQEPTNVKWSNDDIPNKYQAGIPYEWELSDSVISKTDKLNFIKELKRVLKSKNESIISLKNKYGLTTLDSTIPDDILFKISDEYNIPIKQNRYLNKTFNHTSKIKNWFITTINSLSDNELDRLKPILEQTIKIIKNNKGEFNE